MSKLLIVAVLAATALSTACPNDQYCLSCTGTTCNMCSGAYLSNGVCTVPTTKITNCRQYTNATTCTSCASGYYLSNNACVKITVENCYKVDPAAPNVCLVCSNGKIVSNGACTAGANCGIDNCKACTDANTCFECDSSYSLVTATGKCVKDPISNCQTSNGTTCTACDYGYYDNSNSCKSQTSSAKISSMIVIFAVLGLLLKVWA